MLVPLPGTRPVYVLLLALYFDALYSPGDRRCRSIIIIVVLATSLRSNTAEQDSGLTPPTKFIIRYRKPGLIA